MGFFKDFKEFAARGNVIDLAIGVVIGAAFGKIVSALVDDLMMPIIGLITDGVSFSDKFLLLKEGAKPGPYASLEAAKGAGANVFAYGHFLQTVLDFLIVAFCIFLFVRFVVRRSKKEEVPARPAAPPPTEVLLTEIRDLLKTRNTQ